MACLDEDAVLAFCAGTLPAPARARAEEHLAGCDECRVLVSALARSSLAMPGALAARPSTATPLFGSSELGAAIAGIRMTDGGARAPDPHATQGAFAARGLDVMAPTTPVGLGGSSAAAQARAPRTSSDHPASASSPVRPGDVLAGKFVVERVLGAGGMGVVVAARHQQLDQRVALKFLLPQACEVPGAVARFLQEGKASARISSEHVGRVVDTGVLDTGAPYLVMEYLEGQDLGQVLAARKRLPWPEAVDFVLQACEAIAEAHDLGIVHRDLKPANLFLTHRADGSPLVKVLDFGISKLDGGGMGGQLTSTSMLMGSPRYMSPEQMLSAKDVDARTDVWALGVILFELVTGRPVWSADTVQGLCALIASSPAPPIRAVLPEVPEALEDAVLRALVKVRDRRLGSVADLARALAPIAPPHAHVSIDRVLRVAARGGGRASGRPSHPSALPVPLPEPRAYAPPPEPEPPLRVGIATGQSTGHGSGSARITLALAALVGALLVAGLALNGWALRADGTRTTPSVTSATPVAPVVESAPTAPLSSDDAVPAVAVSSTDAAAGVVAEPTPARTRPPPPVVTARRPPPLPPTGGAAAAPVSASPPPAPHPAPVDTSRALVERK